MHEAGPLKRACFLPASEFVTLPQLSGAGFGIARLGTFFSGVPVLSRSSAPSGHAAGRAAAGGIKFRFAPGVG